MPRTPRRSLPWMVAVVAAVAVAGLAGVARANVESGDAFPCAPQTCYEAQDPAVGPAPANLLRPLTAAFADAASAPAAAQPTHAETDSDGSFPSISRARLALALDARPERLILTTRGLLEAQSVTDGDFLPHAVRLAEADLDPDPEDIVKTSLLQVPPEKFIEEYDPWEPFNEATFTFNRKLDQFVLKPVAKVWDKILPDRVKQSLKGAIDNLAMPRRLVNKLFQFRLEAAGLELARFVVNSTVGIAGFFDVAKALGIEKSDADTGQTFGVYGAGPGPYLILPFLHPLTVRDAIGFAADSALDPFNYVIFPLAALVTIGAADRINERALNLELFENIEETVVDLYSAVRNAYLQRRDKAIRDAIKQQIFR